MGDITKTTGPSRLEQALACREAADWVRDPASPKVHYIVASNMGGDIRRAQPGQHGLISNDPAATHWCALGRVGYLLDSSYACCAIPELANRGRVIADSFNIGDYATSAAYLERVAAEIEATLPTTTEDSRAVPVGDMVIA